MRRQLRVKYSRRRERSLGVIEKPQVRINHEKIKWFVARYTKEPHFADTPKIRTSTVMWTL